MIPSRLRLIIEFMHLKLPLAAITDEFSADVEAAASVMAKIGMTGAELRVAWGTNVMDLSDAELDRIRHIFDSKGLQTISIASPLLKCVLPDAPSVDDRFQHDIFGSKHTYEDQPRLTQRVFQIAKLMGAKIIRVFSFWRTVEPQKCLNRVVEALLNLAKQAETEGLLIAVENEHACNVATATEAAALLKAADHPNLKLVWDPANALVAGENPFPHGYRLLPPGRIAHVHAKDCHIRDGKPQWGPVGTCAVDWKGQIESLLRDGYRGYISLETHWPGPDGDKMLASTICGWNLKHLLMA